MDTLISYLLEFCLLIVSITLLYFLRNRNQRLPPGPWTLPLIGYRPFVGNYPHITFKELGKKYGPVFGLHIGTRYVVVLNDYESTVEAYRKEETTGRPLGTFYNYSEFPHMEDMSGPDWKEHRRFFSGFFRNLYRTDVEIINLQSILSVELDLILATISKEENNPSVNLRTLLREETNNTIFKYIFGHIISPDDPFCKDMHDQIWGLLGLALVTDWTICFPELNWLWRRILPEQRKLKTVSKKVDKFISEEIEKHKQVFDPNNLRDFIDHSLLKEKTSQKDSSLFCDGTCNSNIQLLLLAGTDTTRSSLEWMFMLLAKFPDIQDKVFQEIKEVLGLDVKPNWENRDKLPYTMATLMECMRFKTVFPVSTARRVMKDFTVRGYDVPKGSLVVSNLWGIHMDEKYWDNPSEFNPEHYLTKDGQLNTNAWFFPFSYGKRDCPGKKQAMIEVFLFLTTILQKYKIHPTAEGVSLEENHDLAVGAKKPYVRFEARTKA